MLAADDAGGCESDIATGDVGLWTLSSFQAVGSLPHFGWRQASSSNTRSGQCTPCSKMFRGAYAYISRQEWGWKGEVQSSALGQSQLTQAWSQLHLPIQHSSCACICEALQAAGQQLPSLAWNLGLPATRATASRRTRCSAGTDSMWTVGHRRAYEAEGMADPQPW